jgi:HK97 gp10 family phage protein
VAFKFTPGTREAIGQAVDHFMDGLGKRGAETARRLCPVDTGFLRSTIGHTYRTEDRTIVIHADANYSIYVEYGTSSHRAQPFLRPAVLELQRATKSVRVEAAMQTRPGTAWTPKALEGKRRPAHRKRPAQGIKVSVQRHKLDRRRKAPRTGGIGWDWLKE